MKPKTNTGFSKIGRRRSLLNFIRKIERQYIRTRERVVQLKETFSIYDQMN